jgi:hypothetical protein
LHAEKGRSAAVDDPIHEVMNTNTKTALNLGCILIVASACGEDVVLHEGTGGEGANDGGAGSGAGADEGGTTGDAGAGGDALAYDNEGYVSITVSGVDGVGTSGIGLFDAEVSDCLLIVAKEGCELSTCVDVDAPGRDAGMVRMTSASLDLTLTPNAEHFYSGASSVVVPAGEVVTFAASGSAEVPAFVIDVPALGFLLDLAPTLDPMNVSRSSGLPLSWIPDGGGGTVVVYLYAVDNATAVSTSLRCSGPNEAGALELPPWALGLYPEGEALLYVAQTRHTDVVSGGWKLGAGVASLSHRASVTLID